VATIDTNGEIRMPIPGRPIILFFRSHLSLLFMGLLIYGFEQYRLLLKSLFVREKS